MPKFVPIPNFDSLSPQTTKGDLISRSTTQAVRVGVGTDNTVLTADSSQAGGVKWTSVTSLNNLNVATLTGATTLTSSNDVLLVSGTTFAATLFAAASNSGKVIEIIKTDGLPTPISVIGTGFIGVTLCTQNESYRILCDGTTFWPIAHKYSTGATTQGTLTFTASTSGSFVKGASILVDSLGWARVSDRFARVFMSYRHAVAGTNGTGNIEITMPTGLVADTSLGGISLYTGTTAANARPFCLFSNMSANIGGNWTHGNIYFFDSTHFCISHSLAGTGGIWGSASGGLANAVTEVTGWVDVPIAGWGP